METLFIWQCNTEYCHTIEYEDWTGGVMDSMLVMSMIDREFHPSGLRL